MDNLNDIDRVSELNWCQYVIRCLTKHTSHWQKNKKNYYTGPTLFLTLFYVDRVVLSYRTVPRSIPATIKWTNELITERQSMEIVGGGFGEGFPNKPCTIDEILNPDLIDNELINAAAPNQPTPNEEHIVDEPEPNNPPEPPCEQPNPSNAKVNNAEPSQDNQDKHSVTDKLITMTKTIYDTFTNIITLIDALPEKMLENAILRKTLERALLGLSQDIWEDVINVVDDIEKTSRKESTTEDKNKGDVSLAKTEEEHNKKDSVEDEPQTIAKKDKGKGKMHAEEDVEMQEQDREKVIKLCKEKLKLEVRENHAVWAYCRGPSAEIAVSGPAKKEKNPQYGQTAQTENKSSAEEEQPAAESALTEVKSESKISNSLVAAPFPSRLIRNKKEDDEKEILELFKKVPFGGLTEIAAITDEDEEIRDVIMQLYATEEFPARNLTGRLPLLTNSKPFLPSHVKDPVLELKGQEARLVELLKKLKRVGMETIPFDRGRSATREIAL
ncbi:hypothetical protein C2S53_012371 [Perilla frutescens var. hirtella]|uniref:Uncharacterized protein n=1 Tax=Perilla frutescens var. hirtella TaxID=608512 RepID=A0AAD4J895_PERFH|nr:hypothetical protein C2S53_012371 [Perilla frutescens var. hirtella]